MQENNIIKAKEGYYIKEKNDTEYKFLPFEKFYSLEKLIDITKNLKKLKESN